MSEMDDKMSVFGEWPPLNPSPRTFMSNFLNEEFGSKSFSDQLVENDNKMPLPESERQKVCMNSNEEFVEDGFGFSSNISLEPNFFDGRKSSSRGGLAQRIARAGFNTPTINTSRIKSSNMGSSASEVRSPYLTIPPGLSPTTLLDSPVFLSNSMVQPSPTTGKFSFSSNVTHSLSISASDSSVQDKCKDHLSEDIASRGFSFKPHLNPTTLYCLNTENMISSAVDGQPLKGIEFSTQKEFNFPGGFSQSIERKDGVDDNTICPKLIDSVISNKHSPPLDQPNGEVDTKGEISSISVTTVEEDGYNWRKYGQKQVKGSEFPRSYYKCTHTNCQVKKKVERSLEGHVTEIIYKGAHNHAKPLLKSRSGIPPSHLFNDTQANLDDLMDATLSNDVEAIDISSSISKEEEEEDGATHGSVAIGGDGEGDESESKRRKVDDCAVEMNTGSRAAREPRVVVQTTSEVDILDDGYRWRKYGQKVVKGNPNPRSYYKCTNPGCTVRKHVERASHDLKSVITTYEGKHNHEVPVARNSSHSSSAPSTASSAQRRLELTQEVPMRFDGSPLLSTLNLPGFSFGMDHQGLATLGIGGMGQMGQVKMPPPFLGPIHYNPQLLGSGFMVPKGEPKEEPMNANAYHQVLMSRHPLGP